MNLEISQTIKPITEEDALKDYMKLKQVSLDKVKPKSRIGQKAIDFFTFHERLNTKGKRGISFYEYFETREQYHTEYYNKFLSWLQEHRQDNNPIKLHYEIFRVYFSAITSFSPITAMMIYNKYKPTNILDFTAGWGGRMIGATALNICRYTGIEQNQNLVEPYERMIDMIRPHSTTTVEMIFMDCLQVDYSTIEYDMVLTSPPYYNTEIYNGMTRKSTEDWNKFYKTIIQKTYLHLRHGGTYCLNLPTKAYLVAVEAIGREADELFNISQQHRQKNNYKEKCYVWRKV